MRKIVVLVLGFALIGLGSSTALAQPKGTKWADPQRSRSIGSTACGYTWGLMGVGKYEAGKWVSKKNSQFVSYAQLAKNDEASAKKAKGKKKADLKKSAVKYRALSSSMGAKCKKVNALKVSLRSMRGVAQLSSSSANSLRVRSIRSGAQDLSERALSNSGRLNIFGVGANGHLVSMFPNLAALISASKTICPTCNNQINVKGILAGPDEEIFLIFDQKWNFNDYLNANMGMAGTDSCMVARVTVSSSELKCVDNELTWMNTWVMGDRGNPLIQFDDHGGVYYSGTFVKGGQQQSNTNTYQAVRRNVNGRIKDIVHGSNIQINDFVVLPTGSVIVKGYTQIGNSSSPWTRLYPANGSNWRDISADGNWGGFLRVFPDGNLYFANSQGGINKFDSTSLLVDVDQYATNINAWGNYYIGELSMGTDSESDDRIMLLSQGTRAIKQVFPAVPDQNTQQNTFPEFDANMSNPTTIEGAQNYVVISGSDIVRNGQRTETTYMTKILNVDTGQITEVPGLANTEIYTLSYAGGSKVIANGLRTSGSIVTGLLDLGEANFGDFTVTESNSGRVDDVQLFQ
jgi:hypothetical protein